MLHSYVTDMAASVTPTKQIPFTLPTYLPILPQPDRPKVSSNLLVLILPFLKMEKCFQDRK